MSPVARTDPYLGFRFHVEVDSLIVGGFSEVSGLGVARETVSYREGGVNSHVHTFPDGVRHPPLVLRRGMTDSQELLEWMDGAGGAGADARTLRLFLLDSEGTAVRGWQCADAYPVRWDGPALRAESGAVAVETLEVRHDGISPVEGLP
jgi:phage tail-like protein